MTSLPEMVRRIVESYAEGLDAADSGLRAYDSPSWLDRLDASASNAIGVIFVCARVISSAAVLMWSFFLLVLPVVLSVWLTIQIIATASLHAASH